MPMCIDSIYWHLGIKIIQYNQKIDQIFFSKVKLKIETRHNFPIIDEMYTVHLSSGGWKVEFQTIESEDESNFATLIRRSKRPEGH